MRLPPFQHPIDPPLERLPAHELVRVAEYKEGIIAWCRCGLRSPLRRTGWGARRSIARHISNPSRYPR
jgi:hypothetical protein